MLKMKRDQFKALVKECVRECIKEIMQEQINPNAITEMFSRRPAEPQLGMINPMDDAQMKLRQEILAQKSMMQSQLQRQAQSNPLNNSMTGLAELAGVPPSQSSANRMNVIDAGYTNPSDRLRLAAQAQKRFDPTLDTPVSGPARAQRQQNFQQSNQQYTYQNDPGPKMSVSKEVLADVFEDTMRTTYVDQMKSEQQGPVADAFAARVAASDPTELFAGQSQNWAQLAFRK